MMLSAAEIACRQLYRPACLLFAIAAAACSGDDTPSADMQVDAFGPVDIRQSVEQSTNVDATSDIGTDTTATADEGTSGSDEGTSSGGCPAPGDLPAMYACIEVDGLGMQLLKIQDTSSGNGFWAKTSGTTPGWDQLAITVNLEGTGSYECARNYTEIEFTTKVATANEVKWVANDSAQNCQIDVTRAAIKAGEAYEGTFSTELPIRMSGSFHGRHN